MTRDELLAAVIAERQDCRWFPTPPKTAADYDVARDDEMTCARRRRAAVGDETPGRWVSRRGIKVWGASA